MKKLTAAALIAATSTAAFAGAHDPKGEVTMEPVVVVEEAAQSSSGAGLLIPLLLLVVVAAAASGTSGTGSVVP
jgi:hypothetical protein